VSNSARYLCEKWFRHEIQDAAAPHTHTYTQLVKGNVKLSLYLTKHYDMKAYWGSGGIAPLILDLGT